MEWAFQKIWNLPQNDPRFRGATDLEMTLDVATWIADKRRERGLSPTSAEGGETTDKAGVVHSSWRTDPASWAAMIAAYKAGKSEEEQLAALDSAAPAAADDYAESQRLVREIMGGDYRPPGERDE